MDERQREIATALTKIAWSTVELSTLELIYPLIMEHAMNRQDSAFSQMKFVHRFATKAGCYDAADDIRDRFLDPVIKRTEGYHA